MLIFAHYSALTLTAVFCVSFILGVLAGSAHCHWRRR